MHTEFTNNNSATVGSQFSGGFKGINFGKTSKPTQYCCSSVILTNDKALAIAGNEFSDNFFTTAVSITITGVNKVTTSIDKCIKNLTTFIFRSAPAPIFTEGHCAQTEFRDTVVGHLLDDGRIYFCINLSSSHIHLSNER